jgi:hypothetical protein
MYAYHHGAKREFMQKKKIKKGVLIKRSFNEREIISFIQAVQILQQIFFKIACISLPEGVPYESIIKKKTTFLRLRTEGLTGLKCASLNERLKNHFCGYRFF